MPRKDKDEKLAYQRAWYAAHRERVIAAVTARKHTSYAGVCRNCGGPTVGSSLNNIPEWCGKPECKSAYAKVLYAADPNYFRPKGGR